MKEIIRVGITDLRSKLAYYLDGQEPIAVVRHGHTIGYFVPASPSEESQELDSLSQATSKLNELLKQRKA